VIDYYNTEANGSFEKIEQEKSIIREAFEK